MRRRGAPSTSSRPASSCWTTHSSIPMSIVSTTLLERSSARFCSSRSLRVRAASTALELLVSSDALVLPAFAGRSHLDREPAAHLLRDLHGVRRGDVVGFQEGREVRVTEMSLALERRRARRHSERLGLCRGVLRLLPLRHSPLLRAGGRSGGRPTRRRREGWF